VRTRPAVTALVLCIAGIACARSEAASSGDANAGIDALNARVTQAYRTHDAKAYGALYTDSAVFEWPAFNTVRGRAGLEAMATNNWTGLRDMDLRLTVANRRIAGGEATEFGAFEQSWRDSTGGRSSEFGRYVVVLARQGDGRWLMDRFFGFEDSTRSAPKAR
jgi:ketosteroid isomerase-like protein